MGKPESGPPGGQSVEHLLSTIRQAIEADGRLDAANQSHPSLPSARQREPAPVTSDLPRAPRVSVQGQAVPHIVKQTHDPVPDNPVEYVAPAQPAGADAPRTDRYHSTNSYRFRYSLEGSQTYMTLRNRLSSLNARTRAETGRSMASLLGGDAWREEARVHGRTEQQHDAAPQEHADVSHDFSPEPEQGPGNDIGLRSSLPPEETYVEQFAAGELVSGAVSYSPDYNECSLDQSLDDYRAEVAQVPLPGTQPEQAYVTEPEQVYTRDSELVYASEQEQTHMPDSEPVQDEPATGYIFSNAQPKADTAPAGSQIQLDAMIRQIIEPELARWFDEHLPYQVARAMPDQDGFVAMIQPLIEEWLADNLAPIVEQAVKDEIARITGLKR